MQKCALKKKLISYVLNVPDRVQFWTFFFLIQKFAPSVSIIYPTCIGLIKFSKVDLQEFFSSSVVYKLDHAH